MRVAALTKQKTDIARGSSSSLNLCTPCTPPIAGHARQKLSTLGVWGLFVRNFDTGAVLGFSEMCTGMLRIRFQYVYLETDNIRKHCLDSPCCTCPAKDPDDKVLIPSRYRFKAAETILGRNHDKDNF